MSAEGHYFAPGDFEVLDEAVVTGALEKRGRAWFAEVEVAVTVRAGGRQYVGRGYRSLRLRLDVPERGE